MDKKSIHILFLLILTNLFPASAQQIGFGMYADSGINLSALVPDVLDFGDRIGGEGPVSILLSDNETVVLEIEGIAYLDVTVNITPPVSEYLLLQGNSNFLGDPERRLPVTIKMAYYNRGQENIDIQTAKQQAIEVTGHNATFQIRRRPGGPPGPPPTPPHSGYTPPVAKAYLFIYGDLTVNNVNSGSYTGIVDVHVEYTTYE